MRRDWEDLAALAAGLETEMSLLQVTSKAKDKIFGPKKEAQPKGSQAPTTNWDDYDPADDWAQQKPSTEEEI